MGRLDLRNLLKKVLKTPGKETPLSFFIYFTLNGMGLARASLSIGKDRAVVALKTLVNNRLPYYLENFLLSAFFTRHMVKAESVTAPSRSSTTRRRGYHNRSLVLHLVNAPASSSEGVHLGQ
jgi:hypothetical protein